MAAEKPHVHVHGINKSIEKYLTVWLVDHYCHKVVLQAKARMSPSNLKYSYTMHSLMPLHFSFCGGNIKEVIMYDLRLQFGDDTK